MWCRLCVVVARDAWVPREVGGGSRSGNDGFGRGGGEEGGGGLGILCLPPSPLLPTTSFSHPAPSPSLPQGILADVDLLQRITGACRDCVSEFVKDRTGIDGRIGTNWMTSLIKFTGFYVDPWVRGVQGTEFAAADREELIGTFK